MAERMQLDVDAGWIAHVLGQEISQAIVFGLQQSLPSRRERIATVALQGLLAADERHEMQQEGIRAGEAYETAVLAVQLADTAIPDVALSAVEQRLAVALRNSGTTVSGRGRHGLRLALIWLREEMAKDPDHA